MSTLNLIVSGMSCMGCVNSVKRLVSALPGVAGVEVDLASGRVEVLHDPAQASVELIRQTIAGGGYQVSG
ncbi:MAG: heavy-metal-associated domain-containing protein [Betaproteobacteria bacterium]|nr:heavy-metal-associated domain-containing protein [Betaproteobacteria bacterium]